MAEEDIYFKPAIRIVLRSRWKSFKIFYIFIIKDDIPPVLFGNL